MSQVIPNETKIFHTPVLLNKVIKYLNIQKGGWYIDATVGGGGHSRQILKKGGKVVAIDQDKEALNFARSSLKNYQSQIIFVESNFSKIKAIYTSLKKGPILGILFDLGMSTYQLKSDRGFSFGKDNELDMRMSKEAKLTAYDIINSKSVDELAYIFMKFGEERLGREIAHDIVRKRNKKKISTTFELAQIAVEVYKKHRTVSKIHPSTKTFQAIRIFVNDELENLRLGVLGASQILANNGVLAVISFHSLEDRIIKQTFLDLKKKGLFEILTKKPVVPDNFEIKNNSAARSAKLRVAQKLIL